MTRILILFCALILILESKQNINVSNNYSFIGKRNPVIKIRIESFTGKFRVCVCVWIYNNNNNKQTITKVKKEGKNINKSTR